MEHIGLYQHGDLLPDVFYEKDACLTCGQETDKLLNGHCDYCLEDSRLILVCPELLEVRRSASVPAPPVGADVDSLEDEHDCHASQDDGCNHPSHEGVGEDL